MVGGPVGERRVPRGVPRWGVPFGFLVPESWEPEVGNGRITRGQVIIRLSWFGGPRSPLIVFGGSAVGWRWVGSDVLTVKMETVLGTSSYVTFV